MNGDPIRRDFERLANLFNPGRVTPQVASGQATRGGDKSLIRGDVVTTLDAAVGRGAIPVRGREHRKEPCSCCYVDPRPDVPENRMCTTKGAIGILSNREEQDWCSEIVPVADGRCARARMLREAAERCKRLHPRDTQAFFQCYIPAFSQITTGRR